MRERPQLQRKQWEHTFIAQALREREVLRPGCVGVGFGVGREPLVALFASLGCRIIATDLPETDPRHAMWSSSGEHAASMAALNDRGICDPDEFRDRVERRWLDMTSPELSVSGADFCWSACALEHLGSLGAGLEFIERSLEVLKPGGIAVHTTEFNLSSKHRTVARGPTVLYRERDIRALESRLRAAGHRLEPADLRPGQGWSDRVVDLPPYAWAPHTRTAVGDYLCTSVGLIIEKSEQR